MNTYVPAKVTKETPTIDLEKVTTNNVVSYELPLHESTKESTDSVRRSYGLLIRFIPFTLVWLVLSFSFVTLVGISKPIGLILFSVLTAITFIYMDRQEKKYSASGIEILKIENLTELKRLELEQNHEIKKLALSESIKLLRGDK